MAGGLIGLGHATHGMGQQGLMQVEEMRRQRDAETAAQKAENKNQQMQLMGQGAALGGSEYGGAGMALGALLGYGLGEL